MQVSGNQYEWPFDIGVVQRTGAVRVPPIQKPYTPRVPDPFGYVRNVVATGSNPVTSTTECCNRRLLTGPYVPLWAARFLRLLVARLDGELLYLVEGCLERG
jgi:hypothetical protein